MRKKKSNILVIEQDKKQQDLIKDQIHRVAERVHISTQSIEAMNYIEERHPDIIIIDLFHLDMSGYELTRVIKNNYNIPVITLTNRSTATHFIRAQQEGADACLQIPFKELELLETVKNLL